MDAVPALLRGRRDKRTNPRGATALTRALKAPWNPIPLPERFPVFTASHPSTLPGACPAPRSCRELWSRGKAALQLTSVLMQRVLRGHLGSQSTGQSGAWEQQQPPAWASALASATACAGDEGRRQQIHRRDVLAPGTTRVLLSLSPRHSPRSRQGVIAGYSAVVLFFF